MGITAFRIKRPAAGGGGGGGSPAWYTAMTAGQWSQIPDSKLENCPTFETDDTFPPYTGGGTGNPGSWNCMAAFGGGTLITGAGYMYEGSTRYDGEIFLQKGGGHQLGAQAPYFLPLLYDTASGTPKWKKVYDSKFDGGGVYICATPGVSFVGGYPVASQTYASLSYIESENKMYQIACTFCHKDNGSGNNSGDFQSVARSLTLNCGTVSPDVNNPFTEIAAPPVGGCGAAAHEKPNGSNGTKGRIWYQEQGTGQFGYYDPAADTYSSLSGLSYAAASQPTMAIDQNRGIACIVGHYSPGLDNTFAIGHLQLSNIAQDWYSYSGHNNAALIGLNVANPGSTPTPGDANGNDPTIVWNQDDDCFVVWYGGKTLHKLRPPASSPYKSGNNWTWDPVTPAGGDTPSSNTANFGSTNGQGTYGRFQYISNPLIRGYMLVHGPRENVYFYKV